jgi:thiol-disulfide isomerase/thioredoxin
MRLLKIGLGLFCSFFVINCTEKGSVLHDTKGNVMQVSELRGKWVIVNYWADWCESCIKEIPELNQFYQHNQDENIILLGVNYDRMPMADLQKAMSKTHIAFPVMLEDPAQTWVLSAVDALPVTFIIDPNGNVAKRIVGENTEKTLLKTIHQLQKEFV